MHELLAPLYYAVAFDAVVEDQEGKDVNTEASLKELCSSLWVAADAWALFQAVMQGVSRWYEWQEDHSSSFGARANSTDAVSGNEHGGRRSPLHAHVRFDVREGQQDGMKPYVAPVVQACNTIQGTFLRMTDMQLYNAMKGTGLEPQIYGM
jgi:TBC1 domain family protein 5